MNAALAVPAYHAVTSWGYGRAATDIAKEINVVATDIDGAYALNRNRRQAMHRLHEALREVDVNDADQLATARAAYRYARSFLRVLPDVWPVPEVDLTVHGEVAFEWILGHKRRLVISFSRVGDLNFASIHPTGETHGREHFADAIPEEISRAFARIMG